MNAATSGDKSYEEVRREDVRETVRVVHLQRADLPGQIESGSASIWRSALALSPRASENIASAYFC